jgi:hypothetical protein
MGKNTQNKIKALRRLLLPTVVLMDKLFYNPTISMVKFKSMEPENITDLYAVEKQFDFNPMLLRDRLGYLSK